MIPFLFGAVIFIIVAGLFYLVIRWAVGEFSLPAMIVKIVGVLIVVLFPYYCWSYFPLTVATPPRLR